MMKKIVIPALIWLAGTLPGNAQRQYGDELSRKIADRMGDSLFLSGGQRNQVYTINMQLHERKSAARQSYAGSDSLLTVHIQRIENSRDSLYRPVLGEEIYIFYKQKKRYLVTAQ